jgi:RNA polymerase sigma factor (sigma-70 family)
MPSLASPNNITGPSPASIAEFVPPIDPGIGRSQLVERLWELHRPSLLGYVRSLRIVNEADAEDLLQDFYCKLMTVTALPVKELAACDQLRPYLYTALRRFAIDHLRRETSQKRRRHMTESIDTQPENALPVAKPLRSTGDQEWARSLIQQAYARLGRAYRQRGQDRRYNELQPFIDQPLSDGDRQELAENLGWSVSKVSCELHRLRRLFAETIETAVSEQMNLRVESDVKGELRYVLSLA